MDDFCYISGNISKQYKKIRTVVKKSLAILGNVLIYIIYFFVFLRDR